MDAYQTIIVTRNAGILTVALNRPDKLNVLNSILLDELADIFSKAATDNAVQGLLITGNGKVFSAGADIHQFSALDAKTGLNFSRRGQCIFDLLEKSGKPSLCAVNGLAFGGGCELAMSATMRIASEKATFAQPEVKLGLIPGYGGTQRLARLVGKGRALDLCMTGRTITAPEALSFGLVSEIVVAENLLKRAEEILVGILTMAPLAVRAVMQVIHGGYDLPLDKALELEAEHFGLLCQTRDKDEGVAAFLAKRFPCFEGK